MKLRLDASQVLKGLEVFDRELHAGLRKCAGDAASAIRDRARALVPVDTGETRDSIVAVKTDEGARVVVDHQDPAVPLFIEFGAAHVPARPFFRPAVDDEQDRFRTRVERAVRDAIEKATR